MNNSAVYRLATPYPYLDESIEIDAETFAAMWNLLERIFSRWELPRPASGCRSQLLVFMQNRIKVDLNYYADYKNAACVLEELTRELGEQGAYDRLLTDRAANIAPPETRIARARQKVSNELIVLALAMGGFKRFGAANALGYIGGANLAQHTPYRVGEAARDE